MSAGGTETSALVALTQDSAGQPPSIRELERAGGAHALLLERNGLFAEARLSEAQESIDAWASRGISARAGTELPASLSDMREPPALLFHRGEPSREDLAGVAIIGSRRPSSAGVIDARRLSAELVAHHITVVSGLAAGIDTAAHQSALRAGGRTLAVIGTGHDRVYPAENGELQAAVHVVVSQFLPGQPPAKDTFPRRNAVMAALSRATVVVDAGERSGARIQARHAVAQGRRLILLDRVLTNAWAQDLVGHPRVRVITSERELIDAL